MGPRLRVAFELPADLRPCPVPPLLLQPLVENAIKHGLEPKVEGGRIAVSARRVGTDLHLAVRDTGIGPGALPLPPPSSDPATPASPLDAGTRYGTAHVRARLQAMFGERASFTLQAADDAEGGTLALIVLPCPSDTAA
jgi:sensor histidine kinase YesM